MCNFIGDLEMKKILFCLLLVSSLAVAENEFRYTGNKAGGNIFFTTSPCVRVSTQERIPNKWYVYSTDANGNNISDGCYEYKVPFYFVKWNGGGNLSINADDTIYMGTK